MKDEKLEVMEKVMQDSSNTLESQLLYFVKIGKNERKKVVNWIRTHTARTARQEKFFSRLQTALQTIDYEYLIPIIEPSFDNGRIYYQEGQKVLVNMHFKEYKKKAIEFAPEYHSDLATLEEVILWYGYRLAMGYWNISYICDNVPMHPEPAKKKLRLSGYKKIAAARDGVENTFKLVRFNDGLAVIGKSFASKELNVSIARVEEVDEDTKLSWVSPVVVLRKV